jgi:hypothetical protein
MTATRAMNWPFQADRRNRVLDENEAHAAALSFARNHITGWSDRNLVLCLVTNLQVEGRIVFGIAASPLPDGRVPRLGGNFPILVNTYTGECRQVAGLDEYRRLSRTAPS